MNEDVMSVPPLYHLHVGVDIAAATFTAVWATQQRPETFAQTPTDFATFQRHLLATHATPQEILLVMEATGSYWVSLAAALHAAGFQVSVVNPKAIHNYAKSLPRRAKTDALDAQVLRRFAAERQPPIWTPPPAVYHEL
jgi:transposase